MKLSALIIAKNEEAIVRNALESVKDFDEIVFVDTGSTDSTLAIAREYTDKIFNFEWCDDFAAARNFAIEKATGDWLFSIDCDHTLASTVDEVRAEIEKAEAGGHVGCFIKAYQGKHFHWGSTLFKKGDSKWVGKVHEYISPRPTFYTDVVKNIGYSGNHAKDPDRNLRILEASPATSRNLFYNARELYERKRYDEAIAKFQEYFKNPSWDAERAEAYLTMARCYWFTNRGDEARKACMEAIRVNPDFKEALLLMSAMHFEPWKSKWKRIADNATNKDVLFVRN